MRILFYCFPAKQESKISLNCSKAVFDFGVRTKSTTLNITCQNSYIYNNLFMIKIVTINCIEFTIIETIRHIILRFSVSANYLIK